MLIINNLNNETNIKKISLNKKIKNRRPYMTGQKILLFVVANVVLVAYLVFFGTGTIKWR